MSDLNIADEPETSRIERHASWAELFFDLVVVAGVAALAHVLEARLDAAALGLYGLLFLSFWLSWTTFMLYGNVAAGQTRVIRLLGQRRAALVTTSKPWHRGATGRSRNFGSRWNQAPRRP